MPKDANSILLWNTNDCPSDSAECIYNISKLLKVTFTSIIVMANDHSQLSPDLSDAATILPISIRCGEHSIHDAIVDVVQSIMKNQKYNFVIISNDYAIWIDIFQRIQPTNLVFISKNDPRQSLSFSFLPDTVKCSILQWPSLREVTGSISGIEMVNDVEDDMSTSSQKPSKSQKKASPQQKQMTMQQKPKSQQRQQQQHQQQQPDFYSQQYDTENDYNSDANIYDDNEEDITDESSYSYSKKNQQKVVFNQKSSPPPERIKPLSNLEKHQIDLRSPTGPSKPPVVDSIEPKKSQFNQASKDQPSIPLQFQPLIEAMKSIGKSMISLSDLEEQFNICCKNLNLPPQDLKTMIDKASSNGLIIFDSSINYVRFKNRQIANTQIVYT
ncbi:hypothetical protein M9Y10_035617 [Tritrichomonas musculus]|uniref:NYN domain-containing protein n=1 Tax=Tritrichomonas musculus TaxID=1915356 RepID=A0ABR2GW98_9EUKA